MGSNGKTPWMTFNGEEVADSQSCIDLLRLKFQKDLSSHLTAEERAQARAFRLMMEEHFYWSYSTYRWGINKARDLPAIMHKVPLPPFLIQKFARHTVNQAKCQGIGRHADDRVIELGLDDLRALSAFLGESCCLRRRMDGRRHLNGALLGCRNQVLPDGRRAGGGGLRCLRNAGPSRVERSRISLRTGSERWAPSIFSFATTPDWSFFVLFLQKSWSTSRTTASG